MKSFPLSHFPTFLCKMGFSKREVKKSVLFFAFLLPFHFLMGQTLPINATRFSGKAATVPVKKDSALVGVDVADLFIMKNHILGFIPLPNSHKMVAADVNYSGSMTTFDMLEIKKLVLSVYNETNWPSTLSKSPFTAFVSDSLPLNAPNPQPFGISLNSNRYEVAGEYVTIPVYAASNAPLKAWQMAVRFDPNLWSFVGVSKGNLKGMTPNDFGLTQVEDGIVRALWLANPADEEDHLHAGDCLFYITLKAKKTVQRFANLLKLSPESMECTGTTDGYDSFVLTDQEATVTERIQEDAAEYWVATGYPNPFTESFQVQVSIPEASKIRLLVLDAFGRPIVLRDQQLDKGQHTLSVDEAAQLPTGVYRWEIRTGPITRAGGVLVKQ